MVASYRGDAAVVDVLLNYHANVDLQDNVRVFIVVYARMVVFWIIVTMISIGTPDYVKCICKVCLRRLKLCLLLFI